MYASTRSVLRVALLLAALAVSACGGSGGHSLVASGGGVLYPGITCAPFARELSGIALYGDAATWWEQADGRPGCPRTAPGSTTSVRRYRPLNTGSVL